MSTVPERVGNLINGSCVAYGLTIAKETGILRALIDANVPLTAKEIADDKSLKERYVREILSSLGTAELLHMTTNDNGEVCYYLEDGDKQAFNTPLYAFISFVKVLGSIYDDVKPCFKEGGPNGLRYSESVHEVMDELNTFRIEGYLSSFLGHIVNLRERLETGIQVIEFGSGRGRLLAELASMFPNSTFTASENRPDLLEIQRARWGHVPNISFSLYDLCALPEVITEKYDWIFCVDVIHDLPQPLEALKGIYRLLKEETGVFSFIDMATSGSPIADKGKMNVACYYTIGSFLCIPESYQQPDSMALGPCWGRQKAIELAKSAGFVDVKDYNVENVQALFVCKP